jgi:hypothetical protein
MRDNCNVERVPTEWCSDNYRVDYPERVFFDYVSINGFYIIEGTGYLCKLDYS